MYQVLYYPVNMNLKPDHYQIYLTILLDKKQLISMWHGINTIKHMLIIKIIKS